MGPWISCGAMEIGSPGCHRRDRGQSDAINQGLRLASGDIVAYLNSDDLYLPGGVRAIADGFRQQPTVGLAYGDCRVIDEAGKDLGFLPQHPFNLRRTIERGEFLPQQAVFWRREAMTKVGLLDDSLHYAMDYEYFIRIATRLPSGLHPAPCSSFSPAKHVEDRVAIRKALA